MNGENALQIVYVSTSWPWWWHAMAITGAACLGLAVVQQSNRLLDWFQDWRHRREVTRRLQRAGTRTRTEAPLLPARPPTPLSHYHYLPPLAKQQIRHTLNHETTQPARPVPPPEEAPA